MSAETYPLQWPHGWSRTSGPSRKSASVFKVTIGAALDHLYDQLDILGAQDIVVSSNMQVRLDGRPLAKGTIPQDTGVCVYFTLKGKSQCIPCDKWTTVLGNIRAIGLTVEALRSLERWGAKEMVDAAFSGFKALPGGSTQVEAVRQTWWEVLQVSRSASKDEIKAAYRQMAHIHHPDKGGSTARFTEITKAYEEGMLA